MLGHIYAFASGILWPLFVENGQYLPEHAPRHVSCIVRQHADVFVVDFRGVYG